MTYTKLMLIDPSVEDNPLGGYAEKWLEFMEQNHPELLAELVANKTLVAVARSVDDSAWAYRELLDTQYMEHNPRPEVSFEKIAAWERTRAFYTDSAVMREKVLIPRTVT